MLRDFSKPILDIKGVPVLEGGVVTFAIIAERVLLMEVAAGDDANKLRRYRLALKICNAPGPIEITVDEAKIFQDQVRATCGALVVGRLDEFLNEEAS